MNRAQVRIAAAGAVVLSIVALAAACGGSGGSTADAASGGKINLVAYSTPEASYAKLIPAFNKTPEGKGVTFTQSYGASGDQSRAVAAGQAADVVHFALEPDISRLVDAKLVSPNWNQNQYNGFVADTMVVFVVRKGNPKHITTWDDLTRPGVEVITPNPFTSGGARWNLMAAYGGMLAEGDTDAQAQAYLGQLLKNTPVQDDSARASLQTFTGGKGDALLSYENDAIFAQQNGQAIDYTVPKDTILIQNPVAVTSTSKHPAEAKAFVDFLYSDTAQKIFSQNGYRPVVTADATMTFPQPAGLFDITKFGGWDTVMTKFFDPDNGIVAKIEQGLGVSTSK